MMKKRFLLATAVTALVFAACTRGSDTEAVTLTPSATQATIGQTVSVTVNSSASASSWTVTPSENVTKTYTITDSKVNQFTFSQAGTYTIGVRVRNVSAGSGGSVSAAWNRSGAGGGSCREGVDSASVQIVVTK